MRLYSWAIKVYVLQYYCSFDAHAAGGTEEEYVHTHFLELPFNDRAITDDTVEDTAPEDSTETMLYNISRNWIPFYLSSLGSHNNFCRGKINYKDVDMVLALRKTRMGIYGYQLAKLDCWVTYMIERVQSEIGLVVSCMIFVFWREV